MADKPVDEIVNLDAVLDALPDSPTSSDVYEATLPFSSDAVAAVAAKRALAGGGGGGGGAVVLQKAPVHVTAAEILAIAATPKVLVPAPDADTVLLWQTAVLTYRAGTVAYDYDPGLFFTWSGFQGGASAPTTDCINTLSDQTWVFEGAAFSFVLDDADPTHSPAGEALVLASPTAEFTPPLGDGTIDATVYYLAVSLLTP